MSGYYNMNLTEWTPVLRRRLYEYRKQDGENGVHDKRTAITAAQTLELVAKPNWKCKYCKRPVTFEKNLVMRGEGFTLDRRDNEIGHTQDNCVVACNQSNIKKR
jgi:hypothetical protein